MGHGVESPSPSIPLPPAIKATKDEISKMQDWASAHRSMRQRSVRQEITTARAGTRPDYLYQKEVQVGEKVSFRSTSNATETCHTRTNLRRILLSIC